MPSKDPRYPLSQDESLLPIYRLLNLAGRGTDRILSRFLDPTGLTLSQFDVLATLGDTEGLSFKELSQQSLVTGGTLTPVLNRLEAKGLISRCKGDKDSRQTIISLTPEGQALYEQVFLPAIDHARAYEHKLTPEEHAELVRLLTKFEAGLD